MVFIINYGPTYCTLIYFNVFYLFLVLSLKCVTCYSTDSNSCSTHSAVRNCNREQNACESTCIAAEGKEHVTKTKA